jgi:thymidylate kinase
VIQHFLSFLNKSNIDFRVTNGYDAIIQNINDDSDFDLLFLKSNFKKIDSIISSFCKHSNYILVQMYHHEVYAKNFFLYNRECNTYLNLDLYGNISRQGIQILEEKDVFEEKTIHKGISILKPHQEFIQYLIKKIDKRNLSEETFTYLGARYRKDKERCDQSLIFFFHNTHLLISKAFQEKRFNLLDENLAIFKDDFLSLKTDVSKNKIRNTARVFKRILKPTGIVIGFLGPDGSGKSTIIKMLQRQMLPYRRNDYFHLKPIPQKESQSTKVVRDPHQYTPYSYLKSWIKLIVFICQYNLGWVRNVTPLKIKSSLIVFDRYYDDLLVDNKRYRYGGGKIIAKFVRLFIPKPDLYFILTADAKIIHKRKQEVKFEELQRQIDEYRNLANDKRYISIDVDREPQEIVLDITKVLMKKMNERY